MKDQNASNQSHYASEQERLLAELQELTGKVDRGEISVQLADIESKRLFDALNQQIKIDAENVQKGFSTGLNRKLAQLIILILLIPIFLIVTAFRPVAREYWIYVFESHPNMDFAFNQLSEEWSEADLKEKFPTLNIACANDSSLGNMGDRSCYVDIKRHNDIPAMLAAFFFKKGKLEAVTIHVPRWAHSKMYGDLVRRYGAPTLKTTPEEKHLNEWELWDHSKLLYNDEPTSLIGWSAIFWQSARSKESEQS